MGHQGPSGLADWPRPFVFRASHLNGLAMEPGTKFYFDVNVFDDDPAMSGYLVQTFGQLGREGLGRGRKRVELVRVEQLDAEGGVFAVLYEEARLPDWQGVPALEVGLKAGAESVRRVRVRFVTPTELKSGRSIAARPEFKILAARIRDRISALRKLYGDGPLEMDFPGFGERASHVRITRCEIAGVNAQRRSTRTGQVHSIGGFVGEAEYEGELTEFLPYLKAAKWTGVGRQTVWGKGEIEVRA